MNHLMRVEREWASMRMHLRPARDGKLSKLSKLSKPGTPHDSEGAGMGSNAEPEVVEDGEGDLFGGLDLAFRAVLKDLQRAVRRDGLFVVLDFGDANLNESDVDAMRVFLDPDRFRQGAKGHFGGAVSGKGGQAPDACKA